MDLAGCRVERDRHVLPGPVAGRLDPGDQSLERRLVGVEVGGEAALVAHRRGEAALVQRALRRVEDLRAGAQALGEARRPHRHDHELLEVHLVVGVRTAVEHVHHRHRQHVGRLAAEVAPQRQAGLGGCGLGRGERHAQDRVGAEPALVRGAVELDHRPVEAGLVGRVESPHRLGQLAVDVRRRPARRPCRPRRRRRRAARPPRTRRWTAPEGTAARPAAPDFSSTSTSTVGLPRLSRICRPCTFSISLNFHPPLV